MPPCLFLLIKRKNESILFREKLLDFIFENKIFFLFNLKEEEERVAW